MAFLRTTCATLPSADAITPGHGAVQPILAQDGQVLYEIMTARRAAPAPPLDEMRALWQGSWPLRMRPFPDPGFAMAIAVPVDQPRYGESAPAPARHQQLARNLLMSAEAHEQTGPASCARRFWRST